MAMCGNEVFDVFSHLPAKAIHRFKSIAKPFSKITKEPYFVMQQSQNWLKKDDTCFILQPDTPLWNNEKVMLLPLPEKKPSSGVPNEVLSFLSKSARVLASSNGLILCCTTNKIPMELFICNPATKSCMPIPSPKQLEERPESNLAIGLLECYPGSDEYMVFHFENPNDWNSYFPCKIYKPTEGLWKKMEKSFFAGARNLKFNMPVYHKGAIHFISDCFPSFAKGSPYFRPYIMSYNFENGDSTMLRVPKHAKKGSHDLSCDMSIFQWGKAESSICLVRLKKCVFTVWILKDYESTRWMRILKVRTKGLGLKEKDPKVTGFTVMNEDLIFATERGVYSCGLTKNKYMMVEEICEHSCDYSYMCFISYSDTLSPCGPQAATMSC